MNDEIKLTSLGFIEGMMVGYGKNAPDGRKVFDWNKAVALILEHNIQNASAGLAEDWDCTCGEILIDKERNKSGYAYLASDWATPVLVDDDSGKVYGCFIHDTPEENPNGWASGTRWPEDAGDQEIKES